MAKGHQKQSNGSTLDCEARLWAAALNCSNRRMNSLFSLFAPNDVPRPREWERVSEGRVRAEGENLFNAERAGVRCRIPRNADSFRADLHPDLKADFVPVRKDLANPPFNMSDWGGENRRQDVLKVRPISDHGNVAEIAQRFGGFEKLGDAVNKLQSLLYAP